MGATEKVRSSWGIGITGVSVGEAGILSGPVNFWPMWSSGLRGHRRYRQGESPGAGRDVLSRSMRGIASSALSAITGGDVMTDRRQELEALRDELIDRFERYRAHNEQRDGPLDKDMEDQSIELQNDEVVEALQQEAEEELRQVIHALKRIDDGGGRSLRTVWRAHRRSPAGGGALHHAMP